MCTLSVSNVIYHKFSHGAAFYTLNGKNVNVMLERTVCMTNTVLKCSFPSVTAASKSVLLWHNITNSDPYRLELKCLGMPTVFSISFDPIALRMAKSLSSFGCSECIRVKQK